ncbi:MAG: (1-_4)-alpha-D-glucan 1-alpha-D-glucosylmutase [Solirubrobacteraceae bacterium]|nr:(1->4)-alpha-D-glucan 1-alpha-D-glucosylmutase [Solirubrobacteraceae bacterium]
MRELRCTYRLQLGPGLDFARARELVPYLERLGISHLYLSPSLQARRGSTHGYDVVDPTRMSEELGGEDEFAALAGAGLGIVLDIVPNHMGVGEENRWWSDPELRARFFDLDPAGEGYRRFFDIDDLAALRQEDPEVFETTHRRVLDLVGDGLVDGLRVDHPDGLADPAGYLGRLRAEGVGRVWVEKILDPDEELRDWPVSGTVGYEFCNDVCALFVDPAGREPLGALLAEFTGEARGFGEIALEAQLQQAEGTFAREVARLERLVPGRFPTPALREALAGLPIYRTYVEPWTGRVEDADREAVGRSGMAGDLAAALLLEDREGIPEEFVTRFQQTSPPVTAKGVEDTAFYRYLRLLALNEVGGDPDRFGLGVADFHARQAERGRRFPEGLLVTQTHDTKRSGDARARIGALAGMAEAWGEAVGRWRGLNAPLRDGPAPDGSEEYLIYQTLVGVWPISGERLEEYLEKALREAKRNTNWVDQDEAWEAGVKGFAGRVIAHEPFVADFEAFLAGVVAEGERSALGQLLLKLTSPGVPDVYQGDELWALSLVDPDNRRAVDWERRRELLDEVLGGAPPRSETRKLGLIVRALDLRRRRAETFARGAYAPVEAGPGVCAFLRGEDVLVVVRVRAGAGGGEVEVPAGRWRDVLGAGGVDGGGDGEPVGGELAGGRVAVESLVAGPWPGLGLYERI